MHVRGSVLRRARLCAGLALVVAAAWFWPASSDIAVASGETRTITMYHIHTGETLTVTFKKDGKYVPSALRQINHFMRDWRKNQERDIDPEVIDLIWLLHKQLGSNVPVHVICGYRTSDTNESLRRRGGGQAKFSQHILGKAVDLMFPDVPVKTLRNSALIEEWGGVGYYPTSGVPFVHVDTGRVRMWPRIPRMELASLFPNGHTKYLPIDGHPITPRDYQIALANAKSHGQTLFAMAKQVTKPTAVETADASDDEGAETPAPVEMPAPVLAAYTPPAAQPALRPATSLSATARGQGTPMPRHFVYASAGGDDTTDFQPPRPSTGAVPLYQDAAVVGAPPADDDHPEESNYVPFEIASLITDESVSYNHNAAALTHPDQKNTAYLFDNMDRPIGLAFQKSSGYRGLTATERFSGPAVRSIYAEAEMPATRTALADR